MRALHVFLDDSLAWQNGLWAASRDFDAAFVEARDLGPWVRLWARPRALAQVRGRLRRAIDDDGPWLTFAGSGDFHHVSLPLIAHAAARTGEPLTVVHFDNHPDWVKFGRGVHCGSWVARTVRLVQVHRLITVGVCSADVDRPRNTNLQPVLTGKLEIYPYRRPGKVSLDLCGQSWPTIESMGEAAFLRHLLPRIQTRNVYITIDKDVLRSADAATNWDQGELSLSSLALMIEAIASEHQLIGADVVGDWSAPHYAGLVDGWLKRGEAFIDQPRGRVRAARQINEPVNQQLLQLFGRLMS